VDKVSLHGIENYLHQIISYSDSIMQMDSSQEAFEYALKIKKCAYSIDAIISDASSEKEKVSISEVNFEITYLQQFDGIKVMIVDDIEENIEIMTNIFKIFSCVIVSAKSGEEAIEHFKNGFLPDIVSMDIIMPGIDGTQTARRLKALGSKAFFIGVSALKNQPTEIISVFDSWLPKPFTLEHIIGVLSKYKSKQSPQVREETSQFSLEIDNDTKDEILVYAKNGAYSSLNKLINTLPNTPSKEFLKSALQKMDFNSILKSIIPS